MPKTQTANIGNYDFGAPVAEGVVLKWAARNGGRFTARIENQSDVTLTCTLQVSADDSTFADTAATPNGNAVADEAIPPRQYREFDFFLREGQDNYLRMQAVGGGRGLLQMRGDERLIVQSI